MKLVRFGEKGLEKPGLLDSDGQLRDLSLVVPDITPETLADGLLDKLRDLELEVLPRVNGAPRLGAPLKTVRKFIAVGLNYTDHAVEANMAIPKEPVLFMKASSCLSGPYDPVIIPKGSTKLDWEVELGVVIGSTARYVELADAMNHVGGYLVVHDVSERAFQLERGGQWDKGKGCDTFGPIGPWLVTKDEIADPQAMELWLNVNGVPKQRGNTKLMIFSIGELVSYISQFMTLEPGDVITTGTPPGVGHGRQPPEYLGPNDIVTLGISGLGEQRQAIAELQHFNEGN